MSTKVSIILTSDMTDVDKSEKEVPIQLICVHIRIHHHFNLSLKKSNFK